ncbi:MAG: hypothetical protein KBT28_09620, partial [Bacteroidales bacterium]|nr:hypothetical protein [Candidatus Colimorpha merdihippi]
TMVSDRSGANPLTHQSAFPVTGCKVTHFFYIGIILSKILQLFARIRKNYQYNKMINSFLFIELPIIQKFKKVT